jgi:futalosine hydrolase
MKILLVTTSKLEWTPLEDGLMVDSFSQNKNDHKITEDIQISHLICGWGIANITYQLTQKLNFESYDMVINAGIVTGINTQLPVGSVVNVREQQFANMIANCNGDIKNLMDSGYVDGNVFPFSDGVLKNPSPSFEELFPGVKGVTNDLILQSEYLCDKWYAQYNPDVESSEGAAIFWVCLQQGIPFLEIKAIANHRNNDKSWDIPYALENLKSKLEIVFSFIDNAIDVPKT